MLQFYDSRMTDNVDDFFNRKEKKRTKKTKKTKVVTAEDMFKGEDLERDEHIKQSNAQNVSNVFNFRRC
jgi:hypothetical protein